MRYIIYIVKLFAVFLLVPFLYNGSAMASHSMGADMTYECLGGNTYKITISFYRDCIGSPAPSNPYVTINSSSCSQSLGVTLSKVPGTGQEVTPACSSTVTTCDGGSFTGIQEWVYQGVVTLPAQCSDWVFGYSLCCRNAAITTINSPSTNTFYISSTLNNLITPCNSSPTFSNKPVPFLCMGQQFCFNHGAYDPDGDSLVYQLISPRQTVNTNVSYVSPYSPTNPLNSLPGTSFNTVTGDICVTPQSMEVTVMAVLVKEYRNGVLIGTVERDLQLTVMNCANNIPSLTGINGTTNFSISTCANQQICFDVFSSDPDNGQQLTVNWNGVIPGATFNLSSGAHPTGTFCWTPPSSAAGRMSSFTVSVSDDACPYFGSQTFSYNITVGELVVDLGPDISISCAGIATLNANVTGASGPVTYLWNNGSTTSSITAGQGTYWVTVDDGSCQTTDTVAVNLSLPPIAAFNIPAINCSNVPVSFTNTSTTATGTISFYSWAFGDGSTSTATNPQHQYSAAGTYNVRLIVTNSGGCIDTIIAPISVNSITNSDFTWNTVCVNSSVTFTDQSTGSPTSWSWNFGDGGTSTTQNPSHTFTTSGTYQVRLITLNTNGCADTVIHALTISSPPNANAGSDKYVCQGGSITLTASGGQNYSWSPGGQTTSVITVSPSATTTYTVTVTNGSGCVATDNVVVTINPLPNVSAGSNPVICAGNSATLTATGANAYVWSPGGQTTPSIQVNPLSTTTYTLTGTNANGCSNTSNVSVSVNALPAVNAGADVNLCSGLSTTLTAVGATSYLWSPGGSTNSSITVSPTSTTTYTVTGSNAAGCTVTDAVKVTVNANPVVSLSPAFICDGNTTTFDAGNAGSTYSWSTGSTNKTITVSDSGSYSVVVTSPLGCQSTASAAVTVGNRPYYTVQNFLICDGQTATMHTNNPGCTFLWSTGETSPAITATVAGIYTVTITGANGCTAIMPNIVKVNPLPFPVFLPEQVCQGNEVTLIDQSTVPGSTIQSVSWALGDGTTSNSSTVNHIYSAPGTYNVTLIATTGNGCVDSVTKQIIVNPIPSATITATQTCQNLAAQFTSNVSISGGIVSGYTWSFGDATGSNQTAPSHYYDVAGIKNIRLIVTSDQGCIDTVYSTLEILEIPNASYIAPNDCQGIISFTNNSTAGSAPITTYNWNFGTGSTSSAFQPTYTYGTSGTYNTRLTVTDANGCVDSVAVPVTVYPLPVANLTVTSICEGVSASFNNLSTVSSGTIQDYSWDFGDNTTSFLNTPSHTYSTSGTFQVTLIATTSYGCSDTITKSVTANPSPTPLFTSQDICEGATHYFPNNSSIVSGSIISNSWDFGDGTTSSNITPYHSYSSPGAYNVTLTVTSNWGCTLSVTNVANLYPKPEAGFIASSACEGSNTQFVNLSSILDGSQLSSAWMFGDANVSSTENPIHGYSNAGGYIASVQITSIHGCTDQYSDSVYVHHKPQARFAAPNTCSAIPLTFVNQSTSTDGHIVASMWTFGDGAASNEINPQHTYADSGQYNVELITLSSLGCLGQFSDSVEIYAHPTVGIQINNACEGTPVMMSATSNSNSGMYYTWSSGSTILSYAASYNHIFSQPGTYNILLTATSSQGCDGLATSTVTVYPKPVVAYSANRVCQNSQTQFHNQTTVPSGTISTYTWDFGDSNNSYQSNPSHTYVNPGTFNTVLTAVTNNGCSASSVQSVTVNPNPVVNFAAGSHGCGPLLTGFSQNTTISSGSISGFLWNFGDGEISTDPQATHTFTSPGTYSITLHAVSDQGCTSSSSQNNAIVVHPNPEADFTADPLTTDIQMPIVHFFNQSLGYQTYLWNFGDGTSSVDLNPTHAFSDTGTYSAMLVTVNNFGCRDTMYRTIEVKLHSTLFIANSFTPNDDGQNDSFHPYYTNMKNINVWIFDRWGKMLTSWEGLEGSWDGQYQGRKCPSDTYVYKIAGTGIDGKYSEWVGHVSIIY